MHHHQRKRGEGAQRFGGHRLGGLGRERSISGDQGQVCGILIHAVVGTLPGGGKARGFIGLMDHIGRKYVSVGVDIAGRVPGLACLCPEDGGAVEAKAVK